MRQRIPLIAAVVLFAASPCSAAVRSAGRDFGKHIPLYWGCTSWQTFTVINQTHLRPGVLRYAERVVRDQSEQLQQSWGTPCARFGPDGWPIEMKVGDPLTGPSGMHVNPTRGGPPAVTVWTSGGTWEMWLPAFSHEVIETLVDPEQFTYWNGATFDTSGIVMVPDETIVEIADPVDLVTYPLDGANVSDFITPAWFTGANRPYDQARALQHAGQTSAQ